MDLVLLRPKTPCWSVLALLGLVQAFVLTSPSNAVGDVLKIECDTQFRLNTFETAPSLAFPAVVPKALSFSSYWLLIDWDKRTAKLNNTSFDDSKSIETYRLSSEANWDFIVLDQGQAADANAFVPILFYIRRGSGWFMKQMGLNKDNPKVDIVEVGICGAGRKF
jgi:hypothetical protein